MRGWLSIAICVLLALPAMPAVAHEEQDPDWRHRRDYDKTLHFAVGGLATASSLTLLRLTDKKGDVLWWHRVVVTTLMLGAGYYKEVYDSGLTGDSFDEQDMEATTYGIIFGNLIQINF